MGKRGSAIIALLAIVGVLATAPGASATSLSFGHFGGVQTNASWAGAL